MTKRERAELLKDLIIPKPLDNSEEEAVLMIRRKAALALTIQELLKEDEGTGFLTKFDMIKGSRDVWEMGEFLCAEMGRFFVDNWNCKKCPFEKECAPKENGFTKWLKS